MPIRSYLYAPGNRADLLAKVATQGADAVICDLEDAVPRAEKVRACAMVSSFLDAGPPIPAFVRLNGGDAALQDLARLSVRGLFGVVVPKAEAAQQIRAIDQLLSEREQAAGCAPGSVIIQPLIESVVGLFGLDEIAGASSRIRRVGFGAGDYVRDIRTQVTEARTETLYARMHLVARCRFLRLEAPVAHVYSQIRNLDGLRRACTEDRALGFGARSCIHPTQVATVNAAFSPTADELAHARKVLSAYAEAMQAGRGSVLLDDGTFIDEAIALQAKDVLAQAE
jgi:citrate lyase subunit beta / citryl-CoA lyase